MANRGWDKVRRVVGKYPVPPTSPGGKWRPASGVDPAASMPDSVADLMAKQAARIAELEARIAELEKELVIDAEAEERTGALVKRWVGRAASAEAKLAGVLKLAAKWEADADACDDAHEEWAGACLYVAKCLRQVAAELRERAGGDACE